MIGSVFNVIGPVMIGPSSSHTAGAVRIGLVARSLLGGAAPIHAKFGLHGSFAATGHGHGTRLALVAGLLGVLPDDERLVDSFSLAKKQGLEFSFEDVDLGEDFHPNGVQIRLQSDSEECHALLAASVGGGSIRVEAIDGFETNLDGSSPAIILWHNDRIGYLAALTAILAAAGANIASILTSRHTRGQKAVTTVAVDRTLPPEIQKQLQDIPDTHLIRLIQEV